MKDAVATMGGLLPTGAGGRDAVHVAVFSAVSDEILMPRQDIAIVDNLDNGDTKVSASGKMIGVVDPFLRTAVPVGSRFWVYLYPRSITGLSHQWTHPAFEGAESSYDTPSNKLASEQWLREFTASADCPGYEDVMAKAALVADDRNDAFDDDYLHFDGSDAHGEIPPEFWDHVEIVLGRPIQGQRAAYFSCSC